MWSKLTDNFALSYYALSFIDYKVHRWNCKFPKLNLCIQFIEFIWLMAALFQRKRHSWARASTPIEKLISGDRSDLGNSTDEDGGEFKLETKFWNFSKQSKHDARNIHEVDAKSSNRPNYRQLCFASDILSPSIILISTS